MVVPTGLNHVAMSVPEGTLTADWRADLLEFYGALLGWREIEVLRRPDRVTISVGGSTYVNLRERPDPMTCSGDEHFGIVVASADEAQDIWNRLNEQAREVNLEPLETDDRGFRRFRFRHLLPLAIEVQSFPS